MRCHHTSFWYYKFVTQEPQANRFGNNKHNGCYDDMCTTRALENVLLNRSLSPLPNSKVRNREVAPDMEALRNPIMRMSSKLCHRLRQ